MDAKANAVAARIALSLSLLVLLVVAGGGWWWVKRSAAAPAGGPSGLPPAFVVAAPAATATWAVTVAAVGSAQAREQVMLTTRASGTVRETAIAEGRPVAAGAVLLRLESAEVEADLSAAEADAVEASRALAQARILSAQGAESADRVAELSNRATAATARAAAARARLADRTVVAPFAGVLGLRQVSPGTLVTPGTSVVSLSDLTAVKVVVGLPEESAGRLRPGLAVRATSAALPGAGFSGSLTAVEPVLDAASRTVRVQAELPNPDGRLLPGMTVRLQVALEEVPGAVVVPEEALVLRGDTASVWLVVGGKAVSRPVRLGGRRDGLAWVREGLDAGEVVVSQGVQKIFMDGQPAMPPPAAPAAPAPGPAPTATTAR